MSTNPIDIKPKIYSAPNVLGGNVLANFMRSMVNINKASEPVKATFDNLSRAPAEVGDELDNWGWWAEVAPERCGNEICFAFGCGAAGHVE